jgi:hypothetical protein
MPTDYTMPTGRTDAPASLPQWGVPDYVDPDTPAPSPEQWRQVARDDMETRRTLHQRAASTPEKHVTDAMEMRAALAGAILTDPTVWRLLLLYAGEYSVAQATPSTGTLLRALCAEIIHHSPWIDDLT